MAGYGVEDEEHDMGPPCSFSVYLAEGDALYRTRQCSKALQKYSIALDLEPKSTACLVARAKCYLQLGDPERAHRDAKAAHELEPRLVRCVRVRADCLYALGDFEHALLYYHQGQALRPDLHDLTVGIQKCQDAIMNSIGREGLRLTTNGDLSFLAARGGEGVRPGSKAGGTRASEAGEGGGGGRRVRGRKSDKHLLGEIHADKQYLEKLQQKRLFCNKDTAASSKINTIIGEALDYLNTRTEFWRQQKKPTAGTGKVKAGKKAGEDRKGTGKGDKKIGSMMNVDARTDVMKQGVARSKGACLEIREKFAKWIAQLDELHKNEEHEACMNMSCKLIEDVELWPQEEEEELRKERMEAKAIIHSYCGNSLYKMQMYDGALIQHSLDLETVNKNRLDVNSKARALGNLGRVYVVMGQIKEAIKVWEEKANLPGDQVETVAPEVCWLHHELAKCYMEVQRYDLAKSRGLVAFRKAQESSDSAWQLQASMVVGEACQLAGNGEAAFKYFNRALTLAKLAKNKDVELGIMQTIRTIQLTPNHSQSDSSWYTDTEDGTTTPSSTSSET